MKKTTAKKKSPVKGAGGKGEDCPAPGVTRERIAEAAYYLWEKDGRPPGRDGHYWAQAEAVLRNSGSKPVRTA